MAKRSLKRSGKKFSFSPPSITRKGVVFGIVALIGAGAAMANAAVNMLHAGAPQVALAISPNDPVALIRNAQVKIVVGDEDLATDEAVLGVVQRSVRGLAINGPAFRLYGLNSATSADLDAMREQMRISDRMERRDVGAQLWLIENAVEQNDVNRALRHYDTALRIEESSRAILYPALTDAMESALIRERFVPYMKANPPWMESFLRYAISNSENPVSLAKLAEANSGWPEGAANSTRDRELLTRLVANDDYVEAAAHFSRIKGVDSGILSGLALTSDSTNQELAPIAWQPFSIPGIEAYIIASPEGGGKVEIEAEVEAGFKGPVARKFIALEPGSYRMTSTMRGDDYSMSDVARWVLTCAGGDNPQTLLREEIAFDEEMKLDARFSVPADCPVQALLVSADTMVSARYVEIVLASAELTRVRAAD